jgi:hypothetical protein
MPSAAAARTRLSWQAGDAARGLLAEQHSGCKRGRRRERRWWRVVVDHARRVTTVSHQAVSRARRCAPGPPAYSPGFMSDLQNWDDGEAYTQEAALAARSGNRRGVTVTTLDRPNAVGGRDVIVGWTAGAMS